MAHCLSVPLSGTNAKINLVICRDRVEYAAAILERSSTGGVPVIGAAAATDGDGISYEPSSSSSSLSALAALSPQELFEKCAAGSLDCDSAATAPLCAYVTSDVDGLLCAAAFAAFSGRRLVKLDDVDDAVKGSRPSSVTVVVSSALLSARGTEWIQTRLRSRFSDQTPFGILTAHDERLLSHYVARSIRRVPQPRSNVPVDADFPPEDTPYGFLDGVDITADKLIRRMPSVAEVAARLADDSQPRQQVVVYRGHSREYCGQHGRLCSRPVASDEKLACVRAGVECVADVFARAPTRDVRSEIVVLDNCYSARFPGSLEPRQNTTTQLIEAGTSVVFASAGRFYADEISPPILLRLMKAGFRFGEIARMLNRIGRQRDGSAPYVLLFGDPEGVAFSDPEALHELKPTRTRTTLAFHIKEPIASDVAMFLFRRDAGDDAPYSCYVHPQHGTLRALILRLDDERAAMIVLGGGGVAGDFVFSKESPIDLSILSAASQIVERLTLLPTAKDESLNEHTSALGEMLLSSRALAVMMARVGTASMNENAQLVELEKNVAGGALYVAMQHAQAVRSAISYGGWLEGHYQERGLMDMLPETYQSSWTCPACALPLLSCNYRVFGAGCTHDRDRRECERCGVVCDVLDGSPMAWTEAPEETPLGEHFEVRVHGSNGTDLPIYLGADAIVAYVDPAKVQIKVVSGAPARVEVGASFTVTFDCCVDVTARAHPFDFRAILSMNGALVLTNRRIIYTRKSRSPIDS